MNSYLSKTIDLGEDGPNLLLNKVAGSVAVGMVVDGADFLEDPKAQAVQSLLEDMPYSICVLPAQFLDSAHWDESPKKTQAQAGGSSASGPSRAASRKDLPKPGTMQLERSRGFTKTTQENVSLLSAVYEAAFSKPAVTGPVPETVVYAIFEFLKDDSCFIRFPAHDHEIRVDNWTKQMLLKAASPDKDENPISPAHSKIASSGLEKINSAFRIRALIRWHVEQLLSEKKRTRAEWQEHHGDSCTMTDYEKTRKEPPLSSGMMGGQGRSAQDVVVDYVTGGRTSEPTISQTLKAGRGTVNSDAPMEFPQVIPPPAENKGGFGGGKLRRSGTLSRDHSQEVVCPGKSPAEEIAELANKLSHIFDAADEESEGILRHGDLLNLLEATLCTEPNDDNYNPLVDDQVIDLLPWDIRTIMAGIHDDGSGLIDYIRHCDGIPTAVRSTRRKRDRYYVQFPNRAPYSVMPPDFLEREKIGESVEQLEGDEIAETARCIIDICARQDPKSTGYVPRMKLLEAISSIPERVTLQEKLLLMQLVPEVVKESDNGKGSLGRSAPTGMVFCQYEEFRSTLQELRIQKVLNPLHETDSKMVRSAIVTAIRNGGIGERCPIWQWRTLMMSLDISISRFQVHMILCMLQMDDIGTIDTVEAVNLSTTLIRWYFDPEVYHGRAVMIQEAQEAEKKRKELEELQEMSGVKKHVSNEDDDAEEFVDLALRDNREEIEKNLVAIIQTVDEDKTGFVPAPLLLKQLQSDWERGLGGGGLTLAEKRGFMGECQILPETEDLVQYQKHIKTWIPILFELRKNAMAKRCLEVDNVVDAGILELLEMSQWESDFPVFSSMIDASRGSKGRGGAFGSKRRSMEANRRESMGEGGGSKRGSKVVPRGSLLAAKTAGLSRASKELSKVEPKELELGANENRADRRRRIGPEKWAFETGNGAQENDQ
ncbi:unnamed protein product [Amoebophrya sp. A25]|nr:unnamed protein product [Amoebophrya sp. A25]|eukprot:GSA25T00012083001.1